MKKIMSILSVLSIFLVVLGSSIEMNAYNIRYYEDFFYENNIDSETKKTQAELKSISEDLVLYLKSSGNETILEKTFNEREVSHMIDVQNLFNLLRNIKKMAYVGFFIALAYFIKIEDIKNLFKNIYRGINYIYIILISLGLLISTNFTKYFTIFHEMFFSNDLWLLDPKTDVMIRMLPEPFFIGMAINMLIGLLVILLTIQVLSRYLYKTMIKE